MVSNMAATTVFVRTFSGRRSLLTIDCGSARFEKIRDEVCRNLALPCEEVVLYNRGKLLRCNSVVDDMSTVDVCLRLRGGKGGFGSMLRALGAQIERTTNREACRDLSGRRMRDVNAQKQVAEWISHEAEREQQKADAKQKKLEQLLTEPNHKCDDRNYTKQLKDTAERLEASVKKGLTSVAEAGPSGVKRRIEEGQSGSMNKRMKGWLGVGDLEDSDSDEDEGNDDLTTPAPTGQKLSDTGKSISDLSSTSYTVDCEVVNEVSSNEVPENQPCAEIFSKGSQELVDHNKETLTDQGEANTPDKVQTVLSPSTDDLPIDLMEFSSAKELEMMGRSRIKEALKALGLKCGGTLQQLAERLFKTRAVPLQSLDSSLFAKPNQKQ